MDKLNISTFPGCVEKTLEYIKTALKALHVSAADSEALLGLFTGLPLTKKILGIPAEA